MSAPLPAIFISAVSRELRSARALTAQTLAFLGYQPVTQEVFGTEGGDLRAVLRRKIDGCQAVVQLIGQSYGFEPPTPDADFGRVSYTHYEALYAQGKKLRVHYLLLPPDYPVDAPAEESDELRALQQRYRTSIEPTGALYHPTRDPLALENALLKLRNDLDQIRAEWRTQENRRVRRIRLVFIGIVLLVVLGGWQAWQMSGLFRRTETAEQRNVRIEGKQDAHADGLQQIRAELQSVRDQLARTNLAGEKPRAAVEAVTAELKASGQSTDATAVAAAELDAAKKLGIGLHELRTQFARAGENAAERLRLTAELAALAAPRPGAGTEETQLRTAAREAARRERLHALCNLAETERLAIHYQKSRQILHEAEALTDRNRDEREWAEVQWDLATVENDEGHFRDSERRWREILPHYQRTAGDENAVTLMLRNNLANALGEQGKNTEEEREHRAVLAVRERVVGAEHPATLDSRNNLAVALGAQGRHAEAEREHRAVLAVRERILGAEHPATLSSRNNLGNALGAQGQLAEAEREHRTVLTGRERIFGAEHPATLSSRSNLANQLGDRGLHAEAEREFRAVIEVQERVLGAEHPATLNSRSSLGDTLGAQARYAEEEDARRAVLAGRGRVLGAEHPATLYSRNDLGNALGAQGRHAEAEREFRAVLAGQERVLGAEHPATLYSRNDLGNALGAQGRHAEEEREHRTVLERRERLLGAEHAATLHSRKKLANALRAQRKYDEAEREYRVTLAIHERLLEAGHPITLHTLHHLSICVEKRNLKEALGLARRALEGGVWTLGKNHPDVQDYQKHVQDLEKAINSAGEAAP